MRIAVNTSCAIAGGAITHLRHLLPELARQAESDELILIGDAKARASVDPDSRLTWTEVEPISPSLGGRLMFENLKLPRLLVDLEADVLFHPGNFSVFRCPIPQVNLLHNLAPFLPEVIEFESPAQKIRLRILRRLTLQSLRIARRMIFISGWGRSLVLGASGEDDELRYPVVPFGADHGRQTPDGQILDRLGLRDHAFLLTVSHIYRYKKLEKLIEAYSGLGDRVRDIPLLIVGEPFDARYAQRLGELALTSPGQVVFTGGLASRELVTLMQACRIFVFSSEAENLPITLLEAMAAGCAILTNPTCSMPEVCADAALYAAPPTVDTYQERLSEMLSDPALCDELKIRARRRADDFRWSDAAMKTWSILRESAGRN